MGSRGGDRGVEDCAWQTASNGEGKKRRRQQQQQKRHLRLLKSYKSRTGLRTAVGLSLVPRKGAGFRKAATPTVTFKAINRCKSGFQKILLGYSEGGA